MCDVAGFKEGLGPVKLGRLVCDIRRITPENVSRLFQRSCVYGVNVSLPTLLAFALDTLRREHNPPIFLKILGSLFMEICTRAFKDEVRLSIIDVVFPEFLSPSVWLPEPVPRASTGELWTPLMTVAGLGKDVMMNRLLQIGARPTQACKGTGQTALMIAAERGNDRCVNALLNSDSGKYCSVAGDLDDTLQYALVSMADRRGLTSVHYAALGTSARHTAILQHLLQIGGPVCLAIRSVDGFTPLTCAVMAHNTSTINVIADVAEDCGIGCALADPNDSVPLLWLSAMIGARECASLLVSRRICTGIEHVMANPHLKNGSKPRDNFRFPGTTSLHVASATGDTDLVRVVLLCAMTAGIPSNNCSASSGCSTTTSDDSESEAQSLERPVSVDPLGLRTILAMKDEDGWDALRWAQEFGHEGIVSLLEDVRNCIGDSERLARMLQSGISSQSCCLSCDMVAQLSSRLTEAESAQRVDEWLGSITDSESKGRSE